MKESWNRAPSVASDRHLDTGFRLRCLFVSRNLKMSDLFYDDFELRVGTGTLPGIRVYYIRY